MTRVLFVCADNAGSSQMARALFERAADQQHSAESAGPKPVERIRPVVVEAMREVGTDIAQRSPQKLTRELTALADVVVTIGCREVAYPIAGVRSIRWNVREPDDWSIAQANALRDEIEHRVTKLFTKLDRAPGTAQAVA